jgi:hypothetical protein
MNLVNVGDLYFSSNGSVYEIVDFWVAEGDPWIKYRNTLTGQEYSCLNDAFLLRFSHIQPSRNQVVRPTQW